MLFPVTNNLQDSVFPVSQKPKRLIFMLLLHQSLNTAIHYKCLSKHNLFRLQLIQNIAGRLLTSCHRREHINPNFISICLFWNDFMIILIIFRLRLGLAFEYICEFLTPYEPGCGLRSPTVSLFEIPKARLKTCYDQAFYVRTLSLQHSTRGDFYAFVSYIFISHSVFA